MAATSQNVDPSQDQDFLEASPEDQHAYLAHVDPDFAKASPQDQEAYRRHVVMQGSLVRSAQPTQFEKDQQARAAGTDTAFGRVAVPASKAIQQAALGAGKSALSTGMRLARVTPAGQLADTVAGMAGRRDLLQPESYAALQPRGTAQKVGHGIEQTAEYLIPGGLEDEAAEQAGKFLSNPWAPRAARVVVSALSTGAVNKAQGGSFGSGALVGGALGVGSELAKMAAPKLAQSALGLGGKLLRRGATPAEAVLDETSGIRPATIAREAASAARKLTADMESAVGSATQQGVTGSLRPAKQIVQDALDQADAGNVPRNSPLRQKLINLYQQVAVDSSTGRNLANDQTPTKLLAIKRSIGKEIASWDPAMQKAVAGLRQQVYGAIDGELDRIVPGNAEINQRIQSLINASKGSQKAAETNGGLVGRFLHYGGPSAVGSAIGYREGGGPGALAGAAAGAMAGLPSTRMAAARMMASPIAPRVLRGVLPAYRAYQKMVAAR